MQLIGSVSETYDIPLKRWLNEGRVFKFVSDNLDKKTKVRDYRSNHQGKMVHMYSVIAVATRVPRPDLSLIGPSKALTKVSTSQFLPGSVDVKDLTENLTILVERVLTK